MRKILSGLFIISGLALLFSCSDGIDYEKIRQEELANLQFYIDNVYPGAEPTASGLYYFNEEGTGHGDTIKLGDQVQIYYATWVLSVVGNEIDSILVDQTSGYLLGHRYEPYSFVPGTGTSIAGLEEGITYMQPGTRSHLVINSELAYGQNGSSSGGIGLFKTILMEVEVYKVIPLETE